MVVSKLVHIYTHRFQFVILQLSLKNIEDFKYVNQPDNKETKGVLSYLLLVYPAASTTCFYCKYSPRYPGLSRHGLNRKPKQTYNTRVLPPEPMVFP